MMTKASTTTRSTPNAGRAGAWSPRVDRLPYYERPISGVLAGAGVKPG